MFNPDKYQIFLYKITETEEQIHFIKGAIDNLTSEKEMKVDLIVHKWNKETKTLHVVNEDVIGMLKRLLEYNETKLKEYQEIIHVLDLLLKGKEE